MDLFGLVSWASSAIDDVATAIVVWATAQFGVVFADVSAVESFAGSLSTAVQGVFTTLFNWLTSLWNWLNTHIIQALAKLIQQIHDYLKRIFGPLLVWIRNMINLYRQLWLTYVKPIYDFLQRLRAALVLFRILGFKWAKALDQRITQIENALTSAFLATLQNLNTLANWINFIIDPFGLFQPNIWFGSIAQSIGAIIGMVYGTMKDPGFTPPSPHYAAPAGYLDYTAQQQRFQFAAAVGWSPDDQAIQDSLRWSAAQFGYPV